MANQLKLKDFVHRRKGSPKTHEQDSRNTLGDTTGDSDMEESELMSDIDVNVKGTPKGTGASGHARPASTAAKQRPGQLDGVVISILIRSGRSGLFTF